MSLKLHDGGPSQPSRAVVWFIRTHKLNVELVPVNILTGANSTPEYKAKNCFESVPTLELEDGSTITESGAILLYLQRRFKIEGEVPSDLLEEIRVIEALLHHDDLTRKITTGVLRKIFAKFRNPALTFDDVKALVAQDEADLVWAFNNLNDILGKHDYIAGKAWTLADYRVAAEVSQWPDLAAICTDKLKFENFPNVVAYLERVSKREGWDQFVAPQKALFGMVGLKV